MLLKILGVGAIGYVAWRLYSRKVDRDTDKWHDEQFVPTRSWGWEQRIGAAEEAALLRGLQAYERAGIGVGINHADGLLTIYSTPTTVVSLYVLAEHFVAAGAAASADPNATAKQLLDEMVAGKTPGGLRLQPQWFSGEIDSMNADRFTTAARDLLEEGARPFIDSWFSDENQGRIDLRILVGGRPSGGDFEEERRRKSHDGNSLVIDIGLLVQPYLRLRATDPTLSPPQVLRGALTELVRPNGPGLLWSKGTANDQEWAAACAAANGSRLAA